ncbi:hypothetical protein EDB80DRAFT_711288 [Ilyonectria destructans]|nr:hypothetical protein EDB80DRAFT_711288 [Ilyonectria destructans]
MDMGTRIKAALLGESSESKQPTTATGTSDYSNTPGTYPDSVATPRSDAAATSGHEHNKLHKSNDPRGWSAAEEKQGRGHGHTDSGVGITDSQYESSYTHQAPSNTLDNQRALPPQEQGIQGSSLAENLEEPGHDSATDAATPLPSYQRQDNTELDPKGTGGTQKSDPPYWGNLPRGEGVYNTVTGHGSGEDEHSHGRQTDPSSVAATSQLLDNDPERSSQQRAMPEDVTKVAGDSTSPNLSEGQDLQGQTSGSQNLRGQDLQGEKLGEQGDSHYKEGLTGTAAVGAAGVGAHELSKHHEDDNLRRTAESQAPGYVDDGRGGDHPTEAKEGRSFPLFRRGSKSHPEETVATQEHKEKKTGGFFHRSHDKDTLDRNQKSEEKAKDQGIGKGAPALALAGAGGAAAYAASRDRDQDREAKGKSLEGQQHESVTQDPSQRIDTTQRSGGLDNEPSSRAPGSQSSNTGAYTAGGLGAAGVGAGLLASQHNKRSDDLPEQSRIDDSTSRGFQPVRQTSDMISPTSLGDDTIRPQVSTTTDSGRNKEKQLIDNSNSPVESITRHANEGQYNVLSSGTPSGVRLDDDEKDSKQINIPDRVQETDTSGDHGLGSKAAVGLGAAGLGAGAYESSRHRDVSERQPFSQPNVPGQTQSTLDTDKERDYKPAAGVGAVGAGGSFRPEEKKFDKPFEGESPDPFGQTQHPVSQSQQDPLTQTRGNEADREDDSHRGAYTAAGLGAAGLGAAAYSSRKPEEKKFDKPFEGESLDQLGQTEHPLSQSQQYSSVQSQQDPFTQTRDNEMDREQDSHRGAYTAAGLGAAGLGAAAYSSRKPEQETTQDQGNQRLERGSLGQQQTDPLSQDYHPDARAAAATAFSSHRPQEITRTEQSPLTGSFAAIGGGGPGKVIHKCTECGKDNDISDYITSALKGSNK